MLADIVATIQDRFHTHVVEPIGSLGSPVHTKARKAQDAIASVTPAQERAGSTATTRPGSLTRGPRPTAPQIRSVQLPVDGDIDHARARKDAEQALDSIDFSKSEIVLWVPATNSHSIPTKWKQGTERQFGDRASLALVNYPATVNFRDSVATGQETLKLVLAGIAERGGSHRVTLGGHSQGAWVIGDTIDDPVIGRMVDKAVLYGHPAPARVDWARAQDPRVQQVDDPDDPFTLEVMGGRQALDAIDELHDGTTPDGTQLSFMDKVKRGFEIGTTALRNPALSAYLIAKHVVPQDAQHGRDPHHYGERYTDGAGFLARH